MDFSAGYVIPRNAPLQDNPFAWIATPSSTGPTGSHPGVPASKCRLPTVAATSSYPATGPAEITLLGISPTFRAHPEPTFRLLANALYNGLN